jgi:hypothetical protein
MGEESTHSLWLTTAHSAAAVIKKVESGSSPGGEMGQKYLLTGERVSIRLWTDEPGGKPKVPTTTDIRIFWVSAKLDLEAQFEPESRRLIAGAGRS